MRTILAACLILSVALAAQAATEAAKPPVEQQTLDDQKALQGDWLPIEAELAGQAMPKGVQKTIRLKINNNEYEAVVTGKPDKGTWTIDATASPKGMKIIGVKGPNAGKTFPAIYEFADNKLRVCYDLSGKKSPEEFKTAAGTMLYLVTYKRAEQDEPADEFAPIYGDDVAGVGPIRAEDWFVKTWNERRAHFREQEGEQHGNIVFFGDSITQGWSDNFRDLFQDSGLKLANRGISGDTTRGLLARVDEDVLSLDPKAIVLLVGTNDIGLGIAPLDISENMNLLLAKIAKHDPKMPVVLCAVMPASNQKQRPADSIRALNEFYTEVVRKYPQVTMVDLYTLFANEKGDAKPEEFPDLLHPNDAGYKKWRAALWPVFATLGFVEKAEGEWKPEAGYELLFNGNDLDGWEYRRTGEKEREVAMKWRGSAKRMPAYPFVEKETPFDDKTASDDGRYRAIAGRLVVTTPSEGRKIQRLDTKCDFTGDFTLKLDFRATPNADSGVFVRGKQLQCRDYPLAGPYKELKKYKPQDWNELVIEVHGNKARCTCNGEVLEEAYELPEKGPIGLEGDRGQMEYRRIRMKGEGGVGKANE